MASLEIEDTPMPEYEDPVGVVPAGHGVYLDHDLIGTIEPYEYGWTAHALTAAPEYWWFSDKWDAALWLVRLKSSPSPSPFWSVRGASRRLLRP